MDSVGMATAVLGATQQLTQQNLGIAAIKNAANTQNQLASLLGSAVTDQPLLTSGSVDTNINTTA